MNQGEKILLERNKLGLTQFELAKKAGVSPNTLISIEGNKKYSHESLQKVLSALNIQEETKQDCTHIVNALERTINDKEKIIELLEQRITSLEKSERLTIAAEPEHKYKKPSK